MRVKVKGVPRTSRGDPVAAGTFHKLCITIGEHAINKVYIGIDTHKESNVLASAFDGRDEPKLIGKVSADLTRLAMDYWHEDCASAEVGSRRLNPL